MRHVLVLFSCPSCVALLLAGSSTWYLLFLVFLCASVSFSSFLFLLFVAFVFLVILCLPSFCSCFFFSPFFFLSVLLIFILFAFVSNIYFKYVYTRIPNFEVFEVKAPNLRSLKFYRTCGFIHIAAFFSLLIDQQTYRCNLMGRGKYRS